MKLRFSIIFLAACFLAAPRPATSASDANKIVKNVRKKYDKIKSLAVDFVQTIYWSLADEEQHVTGKLYLAEGNRYRVETETQTIVTDGKTVWTFSKDRNQVIISDLEHSKENPLPRDLLLRYTKESKSKLMGESKVDGVDCYELEFIPKQEDAYVLSTRVWIEKGKWLARKILQEDINENTTRYELKNFKINQPLPASLFRFPIPASADVVDMR